MCASAATPGHDAGPGDISRRAASTAGAAPRQLAGSWHFTRVCGVGKQFGHAISAIVPAYSLRRFLNPCEHRDRGFVQNTAAAKMLRIMLRKLELRLEAVA